MSDKDEVVVEKGETRVSIKLGVTALVLAICGPLLSGLYAKDTHDRSELGYEVLAGIVNRNVLDRLDSVERRLEQLEKRAQPVAKAAVVMPQSAPAIVTKAPATQPTMRFHAPARFRDLRR